MSMKRDCNTSRIFLCSSHVIARISRTIPGFNNAKSKKQFLLFFGAVLTAGTLEQAQEMWRLMTIVYNSEYVTKEVRVATEILASEKPEVPLSDDWQCEYEDELLDDVALRKKSPFNRCFRHVTWRSDEVSSERNVHYNPAAIVHMLKNWMPLYGLWGSPALSGTDRAYITNAKIESWFK